MGELLPWLPPSLTDWVVDRYVRVDLDGGAAMLQSAPLPVSDMYGYVLTGHVRTGGLRWDHAWVEVVFLNDAGQTLLTLSTPAVGGDTHWRRLMTRAAVPPSGSTSAVVRLRLEPQGTRQDIRGWAGFDSLRLDRYPQLALRGSHPRGIYAAGARPTVTAEVLGLSEPQATLRFGLFGVDGQAVASTETAVQALPDGPQRSAFTATVDWQLPALSPGFYRVRTELRTPQQNCLTADLTMAVIDDSLPALGGPFGWTLPTAAQYPKASAALALADLPSWLHDCRVGWLKYPCWTAPDDIEGAERVARMLSQVQERGIQAVGLLDQPTAVDGAAPALPSGAPIAHVLRDAAVWQPLLDSVMTRLTGHVRWWQLGRERDVSFLGRGQLAETVSQVREGLQGYGQPISVVLSWPWTEPEPPATDRTWQAVCRSESTPLTADELDGYLQAAAEASAAEGSAAEGSAATWLVLDPLPVNDYDLATRIRDLVLRMAVVRRHQVEAAFVSDPFDPRTGLLRPDGTPAEMLLPWRTTASLLGHARPVGSLQLPGGSDNLIFSDGRQTMMLVWNTTATTETLFLGDQIHEIDVWGRRRALPAVPTAGAPQQAIEVGPVPKFLLGLDPLITKFRTSVRLETKSIDSLLGRRQPVEVSFTNPADDRLRGQLRLQPINNWDVARATADWEVPAGQTARQTLDITLLTNATTGTERLALDFTLHDVSPRQFTVHRDLDVGPTGLDVEVTARLADDGDLVVRLEMGNSTQQAQHYDCSLFAAGRQFQRQSVLVEPGARITELFRWDDGQSLVGSTLVLRASQRNGQRVLNYTVPVRR